MPQVQSGKHSGTIDFMQTMLGELRAMAEAEHCDMLAYLIGMAEVEANDIAAGKSKKAVRKADRRFES